MIVWGSCAGYLSERAARWLIPGVERNRQDGDLLVVTHSDREAHMFAARAAGFDAHLIDIAEVPDCWPVASRAAWQFAVLT